MNSSGDGDNNDNTTVLLASAVLTIVSSICSIIGSLLIIVTFLCWRDLRTVARAILVFLAIADLFSGIGYMFGGALYIRYIVPAANNNESSSEVTLNGTYDKLCTAQSFITTVAPVASVLWTANLAIYLFFSVAFPKRSYGKKLMLFFHCTAWGIPLVTCVALLAKGWLGSSPVDANGHGAWCWIKNNGSDKLRYAFELLAGKMWEVATYALVVVLCIAIKIIVWRRYRHPQLRRLQKATAQPDSCSSITTEKQLQAAVTKLDQKLIWIPMVFLLLRMWGNIRYFISLYCEQHGLKNQCKEIVYNEGLIYLQSICDPGQGWSNALLYVIFNQAISQRLCPCFYTCGGWCLDRSKTSFSKLASRLGDWRERRRVVRIYRPGDGAVASKDDMKAERNPLLISAESGNSSVLYNSTTSGRGSEKMSPDTTSINSKL